jgi:hypothetical protein
MEAGKLVENARHVVGDRLAIGPQVATHLQVLQHGHLRKDVPPFRAVGDAEREDRARRGLGDVVPIECDGAGARMQQPRDRLQGRGLAGAVRADQGDELALADRDGKPLEDIHQAIAADDVAQFKHACDPLPDRRG